ncbi:hypothetical protein RvY_15131 [Ramazzottius varieornatus]|uniref:Uncharacterized protein n=1 Tax=Ramazzottius varieornatus TaxID=947166 RepID=A0A1D1VV74_RAMVA|nr:hypothetical protein RvY_15131 [Ramazzottius varieornatus]
MDGWLTSGRRVNLDRKEAGNYTFTSLTPVPRLLSASYLDARRSSRSLAGCINRPPFIAKERGIEGALSDDMRGYQQPANFRLITSISLHSPVHPQLSLLHPAYLSLSTTTLFQESAGTDNEEAVNIWRKEAILHEYYVHEAESTLVKRKTHVAFVVKAFENSNPKG